MHGTVYLSERPIIIDPIVERAARAAMEGFMPISTCLF